MVINCHHHPLLTVDQSVVMLDENLLGPAHWFPPGCSQYPPPLLPWADWSQRLWWLTAGRLSQPTLPPRSGAGLHLPSRFSFLISPGARSTCSRGCQGHQKVWKEAGGTGAGVMLMTSLVCDRRLTVLGYLVTEGTRGSWAKRETLKAFTGRYKTQGCLHLCSFYLLLHATVFQLITTKMVK